jgi:hypothetical protein
LIEPPSDKRSLLIGPEISAPAQLQSPIEKDDKNKPVSFKKLSFAVINEKMDPLESTEL